jgi:hypothetical protein
MRDSSKKATEVIQVVSQALADGFQIDPKALDLLYMLVGKLDLTELLRRVMHEKKGMDFTEFVIIKREDLEDGLPPNFEVTDEEDK